MMNKFVVRHTFATTDTLRLYQNAKLLIEKIYEIKKIGNPVAQLGDITNTSTTIQEILSNTKVEILIRDCYYRHNLTVRNFNIQLENKRGEQLYKEEVNGNQLTDKAIKFILKLKSGDKVNLSGLTATCPNCALRRLDNIVITIK